jgi:hypothetical protein
MINGHVFLDSFSGPASDLPSGKRTPDYVLDALRVNSRLSTWDMGEHAWLRRCIDDLVSSHKIIEDKAEPYPWHRFAIIEPDENCMPDARSAIDAALAAKETK